MRRGRRDILPVLILLAVLAGCAGQVEQSPPPEPMAPPRVQVPAPPASVPEVVPVADEPATPSAPPSLEEEPTAAKIQDPAAASAKEPPTAEAAPAPVRPKRSPLARYVVGEGENLWIIAARNDVYGDALLWPLIYQANRDQIKDPRQIFPGQELSIPRGFTAVEAEEAREKARRSEIFPPDLFPRPLPR